MLQLYHFFAFVTRWIHASRVPFFESKMLSLQLSLNGNGLLESSKPLKTHKRELEPPPQFKKITEGMIVSFMLGLFMDVWEWHEVGHRQPQTKPGWHFLTLAKHTCFLNASENRWSFLVPRSLPSQIAANRPRQRFVDWSTGNGIFYLHLRWFYPIP